MTVLPDPPVPGAPAAQWWPPVAMTAGWIDDHVDDFDVLHVHFGLESFSPGDLADALDAVQRRGRPVVYTVHDLDNPQLVDQRDYHALLDVIIPAADRLLTLTDSTAAEIERRWGRRSLVLPHPTLIEDMPSGRRDADGVIRVGMHLRDLRPNIDGERAVRAAAAAAELLSSAGTKVDIEVLLSERVRDGEAAGRVVVAATHPAVGVRRVPRLGDAEIEAWLGGLDLFVLPYRHGTHSGWVELCYDLGVRVAGTDVGHIRAQHPEDYEVIDLDVPGTLADAVTSTADARAALPSATLVSERRRERLVERDAVRAAHADLYASLGTASLDTAVTA